MIVQCLTCEKEFNKKPAQIKKRPKHYCSRECSGIGSRTMIEVECGVCSKKILRRPSAIESTKFGTFYCSKSCAAIKNNSRRTGESHASWKGGVATYRKIALREKGSICNRCGYSAIEKILQVHHVDHNRANNEINNLEVLCPNCHAEEHYVKYGGTLDKPV